MAYVSPHPVRIREVLEDGTAHDVTVVRVEEADNITVLEDEAAVDDNGVALPAVNYSKEELEQLQGGEAKPAEAGVVPAPPAPEQATPKSGKSKSEGAQL